MTLIPTPMPTLIPADWPAPASVAAICTTRQGGASTGMFEGFNVGDHVGDAPAAVAANRHALLDACPGLRAIGWLHQVHGTAVVAADSSRAQTADAQYTRESSLGCAVMTADCLPVLLCNSAGTQVAAAHAGWRGLCAGVLENTVASFTAGDALMAWLGPAIGPASFEVGTDVRTAFLDTAADRAAIETCFREGDRPGFYLADLYALARLRLQQAGVTAIYGGGFDTYADEGRFYSYRRDGGTGRMASLIYIMPNRADI